MPSNELLDTIAHAARCFEEGEPRKARAVFEDAVVSWAEPEDIALMMTLVETFERYPYDVALTYLRTVWKAHPQHHEFLSLCVPHSDPKLYREPVDEPATVRNEDSVELLTTARGSEWFDGASGRARVTLAHPEVLHRRPSAATRIAEAKSKHPAHVAALRSTRRPWVEEPTVVADYFATRFRADDEPDHLPVRDDTDTPVGERAYPVVRDVPDAYATDYDNAAQYRVVGWKCVSCFIERAVNDARPIHEATGRRVNDDGLCDSCRDAEIPGAPYLGLRYTWDEEIVNLCAHLATTYPKAARRLLREQYSRSPLYVRAVIAAWVAAHPFPAEPVTDPAVLAAVHDRSGTVDDRSSQTVAA